MSLLTISSSIIEGLKKNEIFPDVIDEFQPKGLLTISYGSGNEVALGNTLKVEDTQIKPQIQFTFNSPTKESNIKSHIKDTDLFTLVLTDPDAPSRSDKKWSEYAHFITTNIPLVPSTDSSSIDSDFFSSDLKLDQQGEEILKYQGPAPPKGTGKHRYVFLLYKQQSDQDFKPPKDRPNWGFGEAAVGVKKWASEYNLELFAVNFFYAENK